MEVKKGKYERIAILIGLIVFLIAGYLWTSIISDKNILLFNTSAVWLFVATGIVGILFGYYREDLGPVEKNEKILRHPIGSFLDHWVHATGFIILLITGFLLGTRGHLIEGFTLNYLAFFPRLVESAETVNFLFNLHFLGIIFLTFGIAHHITYHLRKKTTKLLPKKGDVSKALKETLSLIGITESPEGDKYEAIERLEYVVWAVIIGVIVITGAIKVGAHIWWVGPTAPAYTSALLYWSNLFHSTFAILALILFVVHVITAAMIPSSWEFAKSMATGWMSKENIKHHHENWYKELKEKETEKGE